MMGMVRFFPKFMKITFERKLETAKYRVFIIQVLFIVLNGRMKEKLKYFKPEFNEASFSEWLP